MQPGQAARHEKIINRRVATGPAWAADILEDDALGGKAVVGKRSGVGE
jgi:hypothetical protein